MMSETAPLNELETVRNIALRKYGRNVYNFGLLESWLKALVSRIEFCGSVSKIPEILNRQTQALHSKTLGQILNEYIEKINPNYISANKEPVEIKELYISHQFSLEISDAEFEDKKLILDALLKDRNELIHHFHDRFKFDSIQNCQQAIKFLDLQREECMPYFEEIRNLIIAYGEGMNDMAKIMSSEEFFNIIINAD